MEGKATRRRFAGLEGRGANSGQAQALSVVGVASTLFRDDAAALAVVDGRHLRPWVQGGASSTVDRYDARLLLEEDLPQRPSTRPQQQHGGGGAAPDADAGDAELDEERFRDLDYSREHELENPLAFSLALGHGACRRAAAEAC